MDVHISTPFLIGLTGTIGSGKSLVRKMLEHLGAMGVDADRLAQDGMLPGKPAHAEIITVFGKHVLAENGKIDRAKLGEIVFAQPAALKKLESILHPCVSMEISAIQRACPLPVMVLEAIKLFESDLAGMCNSIWVVEASLEVVYKRLERSRAMSRAQMDARLAQQMPASEMKEHAQVMICNNGLLDATWKRIKSAWQALPLQHASLQEMKAHLDLPEILTPEPQIISWMRTVLHKLPESELRLIFRHKDINAATLDELLGDEALTAAILMSFFLRMPGGDLAMVELEHFTCQVRKFLNTASENGQECFYDCVTELEAFARARCCRQVGLPAHEGNHAMLSSLGYERTLVAHTPQEGYNKEEYHYYIKSLPGYSYDVN